jgi:16S rRNA (guanine966-N2)-methyltransferase
VKKPELETVALRIIAGRLRSRKIHFECDRRTRPMKDRTREAVMNLMGGTLDGMLAFDLFGGSGVMAFESISRGAQAAVVWEILRGGATTILKIARELGISEDVHVLHEDIFRWSKDLSARLASLPRIGPLVQETATEKPAWAIYCCPPYAMWDNQGAELKELIERWYTLAPSGSLMAVELEVRTPETWLPTGPDWDLRSYSPAKMAIAEKP